jgi:formylglycine-generating enzyme required for sulfatase activity
VISVKKMNKMLKTILFMLIAFSFVISCSEFEDSGAESDNTGSISFHVEWRGAPVLADKTKENRRALDCVASNIETVTFDIVDINEKLLATDSWPCAAGEGVVYGVPAGTDRKLIVEGKDNRERVLYRGVVEGIVVIAGEHKDVETVICDPVEVIDFAFLQYRTFEDGSSAYKGWIDFTKAGDPVDMSAITQIALKNSSGSSVYLSSTSFYSDSQFYGEWNELTSNVDFSGPSYYAGFSISFPAETSLSSGYYTYEATTSQENILTTTVYFPGETSLPTVDDASMNYEWHVDNSLHLTWVTPSGNFDQLRIVIVDQDYKDLLYVKLPTDTNELVVPGNIIQEITNFKNPNEALWTVQTRSYAITGDNNNYARGYSNFVTLSWQPIPANTLGMTFNKIPAGTFTMGSPVDEIGRGDFDDTQHQVTLTQSFYIQTTEVTQGQWEAVMESNPAHFSSCGSDCPVESVSWDDVQGFIGTLNTMGEGTYRLPTEAEWEYAARAGYTTSLGNGNNIGVEDCGYDYNLNIMGWYCYNSSVTYEGCEDISDNGGPSCAGTQPVALKAANDWGLYDMHGNLWEWVQNWWEVYATSDPLTDPTGPASGTYKMYRGGQWGTGAAGCRSASKNLDWPAARRLYIGFRLVRVD